MKTITIDQVMTMMMFERSILILGRLRVSKFGLGVRHNYENFDDNMRSNTAKAIHDVDDVLFWVCGAFRCIRCAFRCTLHHFCVELGIPKILLNHAKP